MSERPPSTNKLDYIDACRGLAAVLVIWLHTAGKFTGAWWPFKNLSMIGAGGVQLFFLVSAVTLMLSWQRASDDFGTRVRAFYVRRLFRIVPMFYVAALLYCWLSPFDQASLWKALPTLLFFNSLSPDWIPVTTSGWRVVEGSWSISVEMMFYLLFPWLARRSWGPTRMLGLAAALLALRYAIAALVRPYLDARYPTAAVQGYLELWPLTHLPVFACGVLLYQVIYCRSLVEAELPWLAAIARRIEAHPFRSIAAVSCLLLLHSQAQLAPALYRSLQLQAIPYAHVSTIPLMGLVLALRQVCTTGPAQRFFRRCGELSFSVYLLHFAVIDWLLRSGILTVKAAGWGAFAQALAAFAATVALTLLVSTATYRWVERPGMRLGAAIAQRLRAGGSKAVQVA